MKGRKTKKARNERRRGKTVVLKHDDSLRSQQFIWKKCLLKTALT